jgi:FkbM family methyltransferase
MFLSQLFRREPPADASGLATEAPAAASAPRQAVATDSATESSCERADALDAERRHPKALEVLDDALSRAPDDAQLHFRRGATLYRWGRIIEAKEALLRSANLGLRSEALYRLMGWCACWAGSAEDGRPWMIKASELAPADWRVQYGLGIVAHLTKRQDEAVRHLESALSAAPGSVAALNAIVLCHLARKDLKSAESAARRAIDAGSTDGMAWANLGVALSRQFRFEEAWPAFERALQLEADAGAELDVFINYGNALRDAGRLEEALRLYERNLATTPSPAGHGDYAFALLTTGRYQEGWKQYEFRWVSNMSVRRYPRFDRPMWNGQDLRGRTILLLVEQGFGDIIQFIRYVPLVKATGATVILVERDGLGDVLRGFPGIDAFASFNDPLPAADFHCPLMSLPGLFGTTVETIPVPAPYLRAHAGAVERWRERLPATGRPRVGIVWAGSPDHPNDRYRSIALRALLPLLECEGVSFVSLQKGPAVAQLADVSAKVDICDVGDELNDFGDTLAVIEQLDLVICVDTSVAHLAGAAGKPTWLLVTKQADFRWLEERSDSPWYPSIRLFRQDLPRDWTGAIGAAARALAEWIKGPTGAKLDLSTSTPNAAAIVPRERGFADIDPCHRPGLSDVTYTRHGFTQYFPEHSPEGCSLRVYGEYLKSQLDLMHVLIGQKSVALDIRPGIGAHTIELSRLVGPEGHVLAYEPDKRKHRVLRRNVAANGLPNVTAFKRDVGAACWPGTVSTEADEDCLITGAVASADGAVDTIDSLRLPRLDLVKISDGSVVDDVLAGANETLWRCRPCLFTSVDDSASAGRVAARMRTFGYRSWLHRAPVFNSENFNLTDRDLFQGATALAVVAVPEETDLARPLHLCSEMT